MYRPETSPLKLVKRRVFWGTASATTKSSSQRGGPPWRIRWRVRSKRADQSPANPGVAHSRSANRKRAATFNMVARPGFAAKAQEAFANAAFGRLTIGRSLPSCPTRAAAKTELEDTHSVHLAQTPFLHEHDHASGTRRQLDVAGEAAAPFDRANLAQAAQDGHVVQAAPLVLAGVHLRRPAFVGQCQPDIRRSGRGVDLHLDTGGGAQQMHPDLLPQPGAPNLFHRPPAVVANEFRDAIDHHLWGVGACYAESAGDGRD